MDCLLETTIMSSGEILASLNKTDHKHFAVENSAIETRPEWFEGKTCSHVLGQA
jgi:hypothetical protein